MKRYKVAVAGLAHGSRHARIVRYCLEQAELVALCELGEERMGAVARELGVKRTTRRYADLLEDRDIDIICIATSDYTHGKMALAALEAGKHLMVETPLENRDLDLLWKILRAAERRNLKVQHDIPDRWIPESVAMKRMIDSGALGEPYYVITELIQDIRQQGGGHLLNVDGFRMGRGESPQEPVSAGAATYCVDTAMWFCGEPFTEVFAYGNRKNIPSRNCDDHDVAIFRTRSGTIARVQCSKGARRPYCEIIKSVWGTKGTAESTGYLPAPPGDNANLYACLTDAGSCAEPYRGEYVMKPVKVDPIPLPKGMVLSTEMVNKVGHSGVEIHSWVDLLDSIEEDRLPVIDVYQAFRTNASQIAARKSKEEGRPISIAQVMERHEELKPFRPLPFENVSIEDLW